MSTSIVQSQQQQSLLNALYKSFQSRLDYSIKENLPPLSHKTIRVVPNVPVNRASPWDSQVHFNVPKSGFMDSLVIETKFKVTRSSTFANQTKPYDPHVGENLFKMIEIIGSDGLPIYSQPWSALKAKMSTLPMNQAMAYRQRAVPRIFTKGTGADEAVGEVYKWANDTKADGSVLVCYTPLLAPILNDLRAAIDLRKCDQLTIRLTYNSKSELANFAGSNTQWSDFENCLYMQSHLFTEEYEISLRNSNFKEKNGQVFTIFAYNWLEETKTFTDTNVQFDIRCTGATSESFVIFKAQGSEEKRILKLSLRVDGSTVLENLPGEVVSLFGDLHGSAEPRFKYDTGDQPVGFSFDQTVTKINFDLMPGNDKFNSGCIVWKSLANPTLELQLPSPGTVTVVHKIISMITVTERGLVGLTSTL